MSPTKSSAIVAQIIFKSTTAIKKTAKTENGKNIFASIALP